MAAAAAGAAAAAAVKLGDLAWEAVDEEESKDLRLSRIGGAPAWPPASAAIAPDLLLCRRCAGKLAFLGQLHSSYEASVCRILYLFTCLAPGCGGDERAWRVLRAVVPLAGVAAAGARPSGEAHMGLLPAGDEEDWTCAAAAPQDVELDELLQTRDAAARRAGAGGAAAPRCGTAPAEAVAAATEEVLLGELDRSFAMEGLAPLPPFPLQIYEEPAALQQSTEHELELLARYRASAEHELEAEFADEAAAALEAEADDDEGANKWLLKFQKRLGRSPRQVVRYSWDGRPLWIAQPPPQAENSAWPPPCEHCGGRRVFELQVLPTLLYEVRQRLEGRADLEIEWGTVMVYTCAEDCRGSSGGHARPLPELVLVQPAV